MSKAEILRVGKEADLVLNNLAFKQAFKDMEGYLLDALRNTDPWDEDKREARVKQIYAVEQVQEYLTQYMGKGTLPRLRDTKEITMALDVLTGLKAELEGMVNDAVFNAKQDEDT